MRVKNSPASVTSGLCGGKTDPEYNCRPIILDPADPTGNLGRNARWDLLAQEARAFTSALCCMDKDGTPIKPWLVKVRGLGGRQEHPLGEDMDMGRHTVLPEEQDPAMAPVDPEAKATSMSSFPQAAV